MVFGGAVGGARAFHEEGFGAVDIFLLQIPLQKGRGQIGRRGKEVDHRAQMGGDDGGFTGSDQQAELEFLKPVIDRLVGERLFDQGQGVGRGVAHADLVDQDAAQGGVVGQVAAALFGLGGDAGAACLIAGFGCGAVVEGKAERPHGGAVRLQALGGAGLAFEAGPVIAGQRDFGQSQDAAEIIGMLIDKGLILGEGTGNVAPVKEEVREIGARLAVIGVIGEDIAQFDDGAFEITRFGKGAGGGEMPVGLFFRRLAGGQGQRCGQKERDQEGAGHLHLLRRGRQCPVPRRTTTRVAKISRRSVPKDRRRSYS